MNWLTSRCAPLAALATLALASCDTGTALNVDLPDTATTNTQYQDFDVSSGTVRLDSAQTQKTDHFLIGRLADNVAGTTTARSYFNVVDVSVADSLPSKFINASFFGNPILDSTVVILGFDRVYGSSSTPARFDVSQLRASLDDRQVYTASSPAPALVTPALGQNVSSRLDRTQVQIVKAADTSVIPNVPAVTTIAPDPTVRLVLQRRAGTVDSHNNPLPAIPLAFADGLFTQLRLPGFSQAQLDGQLKGLAIAPNATYNSGIVSFGRPNASKMVLYFHSKSAYVSATRVHADTLKRSYSVYFGPAFSSAGLSSSSDPRYYTEITPELPAALSVLNSSAGFVPNANLSGLSYAQEGTGLGTRVTFMGLDALVKSAAAGGLTINRAELRVPVKPYSNALFQNPSQLYAVEVNSANTVLQRVVSYLPTDRIVQADGSSQIGSGSPAVGYLTTISAAQTFYTLPITSYLQAYLNNQLGGNPASLVLLADSYTGFPLRLYNTLTLNRAVLDAANIKLRVYYSKR